MNLDDRGLGSIRAVLDSVSRADAAAGLEDLRRRRRRRRAARTVTAIVTATALAVVAWAVLPVTGHVSPTQLAADADTVWAKCGARLWRLDPSTSRVIDRFPTGGDGALAVGGGSVWQAGITTQTIYRYDPASRRVLAQIPIGVVAKHLTARDGALWVSSDSGRVTRIDMATSRVTGTFQVGGRSPAVAVGLGSVWILDTNHAALLRLQPTA